MFKLYGNIAVYDLLETYHRCGKFSFKIVLDKKKFKNGHDSEVNIYDCHNKAITTEVKKWGRKINCMFTIDKNPPDGVSTIYVDIPDENDIIIRETLRFWIIK